ncbi:MAG: hypothetical protein AB2708_10815, partial [Candidatus Thiodiazotropha taylori]
LQAYENFVHDIPISAPAIYSNIGGSKIINCCTNKRKRKDLTLPLQRHADMDKLVKGETHGSDTSKYISFGV